MISNVNQSHLTNTIGSFTEDRNSRLSVSSLNISATEENDCSSLTLWRQSSPMTKRKANSFCGIFNRLLCTTRRTIPKTSASFTSTNLTIGPNTNSSNSYFSIIADQTKIGQRVPIVHSNSHSRRNPQEVYYESRGQSCKKLLKFNGNSNKILLYPEEGWARTASSSYWTITPCKWQPNRCHIEEFSGTQRQITKAKILPLQQKELLVISGHFLNKNGDGSTTNRSKDEFKLYLNSNISMEDYNMGYCLTGFVERRCQQTNAFQMTHFAVIKRQWPSINSVSTKQNRLFSTTTFGGGGGVL